MNPPYEINRADTVREACRLLSTETAMLPVGGGTQLYGTLAATSHGDASRLLDLTGLPELGELSYAPEHGLRIGAGVTLARLAADATVQRLYPTLAETALAIGHARLRAIATVGGNICQNLTCRLMERMQAQRGADPPCQMRGDGTCRRTERREACWASYAGDLAPVLIALDARVEVSSPEGDTQRDVLGLFPADGHDRLALRPGEIVRAIQVPPPVARSGTAYVRLAQEDVQDYPLLGAATAVALDERGHCTLARVVLTGVSRAPRPVPEASLLVGHWVTDTLVDRVAHAAFRRARPEHHAWGHTVSHRVRMTRPFVARALRVALQAAERVNAEHA